MYLGYEITSGSGIQPGLAKTETVCSFPEPCTVKEIRAFIGLTSFFRRAIKDYSLISGPLNKLVRKDSGYSSEKLPLEAQKAFLNLKNALISRPGLAPVDFISPFLVTTDASETHYASCLSQKGKDGVERPCGYSSKLLNSKESKQQPGMRERVALLHAPRHWQPYLIGKEFTLRTDHNPNLALAKGKTKLYDTLTDIILQFMPFKMEFMNGNHMFVDALSRQSKNMLAIDLGVGPSCPVIFDEQVIRSHQTSDPDLQFHFMLHKHIIPSLPDKCQLKNSPVRCILGVVRMNLGNKVGPTHGFQLHQASITQQLLFLAHFGARQLGVDRGMRTSDHHLRRCRCSWGQLLLSTLFPHGVIEFGRPHHVEALERVINLSARPDAQQLVFGPR